MLAGKGFKKVYNLKGGIQAWNGVLADGPVELNLDLVKGDEKPAEILAIAFGMEQSLGEFYRNVIKTSTDRQLVDLLDKLANIEDKHKEHLFSLYMSTEEFPLDRAAFEANVTSKVLEGGFGPEEFMNNNKKFLTTTANLLDLAMMLEAQALDLYMRFADKMQVDTSKNVLYKISNEEKGHLQALGNLREEY